MDNLDQTIDFSARMELLRTIVEREVRTKKLWTLPKIDRVGYRAIIRNHPKFLYTHIWVCLRCLSYVRQGRFHPCEPAAVALNFLCAGKFPWNSNPEELMFPQEFIPYTEGAVTANRSLDRFVISDNPVIIQNVFWIDQSMNIFLIMVNGYSWITLHDRWALSAIPGIVSRLTAKPMIQFLHILNFAPSIQQRRGTFLLHALHQRWDLEGVPKDVMDHLNAVRILDAF